MNKQWEEQQFIYPGGQLDLADVLQQSSSHRHNNFHNFQFPAISRQQKKNRIPRLIDFNLNLLPNRSKIRKGKNRDTANFGKFIFGIIKKCLQPIYLTNKLNEQEQKGYKDFLKRNGILTSYSQLILYDTFRQKILHIIQSSLIVKKILIAQKIQIKSKLLVIKLLENIRKVCYSSSKNWKKKKVIK